MRRCIITVGGLGLLPKAPGTWGSLPPVVLALVLIWTLPDTLLVGIAPTMAGVAVVASVLCLVLTPWAEQHFQTTDPGQEVIDEVAGMALSIALSPMLLADVDSSRWILTITVGLCFVLFRWFDIFKPPPIAQLQRLPSGWGVLLDDLLAGVVAAGCTWAFILWTPW
jgi:phosphatidylglycerophosphatase A